MAITITEKPDSRTSTTGVDRTVELLYIVRGTADDLAAKAALEAGVPATYDGLKLKNCEVKAAFVDETNPDACIWHGTANYSRAESQRTAPETGDSTFSFDTGGGTQHITQSIMTMGSYAPDGETAPDFKGAIGVHNDKVDGVDITLPVYNWAETHYLADAVVTGAYKGTLFSLTGRVNDDTFKGLDAGECLFLGASGSKRGDEDWEIAFRFAASPNKTNLTIGDITGINKKGWEYLWVRYADEVDGSAKALVKRPLAAYVEKVYEYGDLSQLGIGT